MKEKYKILMKSSKFDFISKMFSNDFANSLTILKINILYQSYIPIRDNEN